jgi:hypothetical protein
LEASIHEVLLILDAVTVVATVQTGNDGGQPEFLAAARAFFAFARLPTLSKIDAIHANLGRGLGVLVGKQYQ